MFVMKKNPRFLYAGDSGPGGASSYLLAVLHWMKAEVTHLPPDRKMTVKDLNAPYDAVLLSDYASSQMSQPVQEALAAAVSQKTGLMMIGGWASFSGPFGKWRGTLVEDLLPVRCRPGDDRLNFPSGALILPEKGEKIFSRLPWKEPPAICGMNRVIPRRKSRILLRAYPAGRRGILSRGEPLLVVDSTRRIAAYTSDFAPHWCGGLVDWGWRERYVKIQAGPFANVQVGTHYLQFVSSILRWIAGS